MSDLHALVEAGRRILTRAKDSLGDGWEKTSDQDKDVIRAICMDLAALEVAALAGLDVREEMLDLNAQMAGLSELGRKAVVSAWQQIRGEAAEFLAVFARGFLGGALGGPAGAVIGAALGS